MWLFAFLTKLVPFAFLLMSTSRKDLSITYSEDDLRETIFQRSGGSNDVSKRISRTPQRAPSLAGNERSLIDLIEENDRLERARTRYRDGESERIQKAEDFASRMTLNSRNSRDSRDSRDSRLESRAKSLSRNSRPSRPSRPSRENSAQRSRLSSTISRNPIQPKRYSNREFFRWNSDEDLVSDDSRREHGHRIVESPCLLCKWAREFDEKARRKRAVRESEKSNEHCREVNRIVNSRQERLGGWEERFFR
ncbi:unnamed protein product, partial [Mesorhabditis belari]|uniref:Uncharacterized protein n=1 Tax=Mesorhabditis belari TaxID=2138241 RepID=A0AAF3F7D7_9BILA